MLLSSYTSVHTCTVHEGIVANVKPRLHDITCCQTGCHTGLTIVQPVGQPAASCITVNKHPIGCQAGCSTDLTTGWMFVYTMQPVVNRFDNRLYRVTDSLSKCQHYYTIQIKMNVNEKRRERKTGELRQCRKCQTK